MLTWKSKGRAQKARQRGRTSARRAAMGILPGAHPLPIRSENGQGLFSYRHRKCFFGQAGHLGKAGNILHRPGTCWRKYRPERLITR